MGEVLYWAVGLAGVGAIVYVGIRDLILDYRRDRGRQR